MRVAEALFVGVFATAATDLWQQALARWCDRPATDWGKVGRWVVGLARGVFVHRTIATTAPAPGEAVVGWSFHYAVGTAYAAFFLLALGKVPAAASSPLLAALAFAAVTLIAPWFVLQPGLGLGLFARRAPHPGAARFVTITTHATFGLGLALGVDLWRIVITA